MRRITLLFSIIIFFSGISLAQVYPQSNALRTKLPVKIDGLINEEAWKQAPLITGLIEQRPTPGRPEDAGNKSELYLLYDNEAVYFGGILFENNKDSISQQLGGRDNPGINDFIGVIFDTYQDKSNGLGFYVTPLNEQFDVKYFIGMSNQGEDISWNAVYATAIKVIHNGWSFEMKIPYSALRFSKGNIQDWGMQIIRRRAKSGQQYTWSPVDPTKFGFMNQAGTWKGLQDIQPPLRLSFSPYLSTYLNKNPTIDNKWKASINGGMDVKYGISDGFTMDMTLVPDFGQVQSDNQVLNLSPFEVKFNENRPFFNEGVELFNKGNLFYSRRIGGQPIHYYDVYGRLGTNQTITKNPVESKLINATKISGRTKKKLGLGFFNAITKPQFATVIDGNGKQFELETNPLTNYNVMVADQALKNNSRVTLINTNVLRNGKEYDANVSALDWDLYDKQINWNVWGQINHSRLIGQAAPGVTTKGYLLNLYAGQFKGRFNWFVNRNFADDKYQQADLGYFTNNNYISQSFFASYKWIKPKSFYNNISLNVNGNYSELYKPNKYQDSRFNASLRSQLKTLWQVNINVDVRPESNDYYEARLPDWVFKRPGSWLKGASLSTNRAKKYFTSLQLLNRSSIRYKSSLSEFSFSNGYRFSSKFNVELSHLFVFGKNDYGFAYYTNRRDSVITGLRKRNTVENILNLKYNFNNNMGLTFRLRHYWSKVDYNRLFNLRKDGMAENLLVATKNPDINVNLFNIDMNYTWQIGPGSFVNVNWKTSAEFSDRLVQENYFDNLNKTLDYPQFNSLSVKIIYYLDYLDINRKGNKKKG